MGRVQAETCPSALPSSPLPWVSPLPLRVARPARAEGALPTVLSVIKLLLLSHPCGRPARRARLLPQPLPLCPPVRTRGRPQGRRRGTDWRRLLPAKSQAGRPKPVRPALAERLPRTDWTQKRREGGREGGESGAGRQLLLPLTAARFSPPPPTLASPSGLG